MGKEEIKSYKDLVVWQKGVVLVDTVYSETRKFPKEEMYGLTNQIRRAAISVPANIAEGWGRDSTKNYIQFLKIARGSLFELETMLIICGNQHYLNQSELTGFLTVINELAKMLNKMIQKLNDFINEH